MNTAFDQALSRRLADLSTMPVDTSHLDRAVRERIGAPGMPRRWRIVRPLAAVAASLLVMIALAVVLLQDRPVSAAYMARMHREIVTGQSPVHAVESVSQLNEVLAAFSANVQMSDAPETHRMACCMRDVGNKKVTCILLNDGTVPVTLTVAEIGTLQKLSSRAVMYHGEAFQVQTFENIHMVMVDRGRHRICLTGEISADQLMALSEKLRF